MRVLLLHDIGTPTGGAEYQMLALREGLRRRGHQVRLLSSRVRPSPEAPIAADATCFGTAGRLQVLTQTANPSAYRALRHELQTFRPDVVHLRLFLWQLSPLVLPLLERLPVVYQAAMYKTICPRGTKVLPTGAACTDVAGSACLRHGCLTPQTWALLMGQMALWRRWRHVIDATTVLSARMRTLLESDPNGPPGPYHVIPNGVPERPQRPPLLAPPTVAFAGRLVPEKGVDVLLRAFARVAADLPQARLRIAGQGEEEARLRQLAHTLGIAPRVTWLGHIPRAALERHFEQAWVQAVPSQWDEPFGNVSTEAMMRGTAVAASAVGAQPSIVADGETGFLLPPRAVEAWAKALTQVLQSRALAEQMGQAGRVRACTHFSEERCTGRFEAFYRDLVAARAHAAPGRLAAPPA